MRGILFLSLFVPYLVIAQERCATNFIAANSSQNQSKVEFENWMKERLETRKAGGLRMGINNTQQQVYEVPVVFHIIHDGSTVGSGTNVSKAKILEQVKIINEDFRRQNPDATETPSEFLPVAADAEIQFVLAKQDPEGLPTDGIVRVNGSKDIFHPNDDALLKSHSLWPPEDYLNIYVTDLTGGNLGYAQYPFSNLPGIKSELENYRNTDGVVIDYKWVGVNDNTGSFNSRGRTATHEIGHFLGLRHIWGEGDCTVDDYCSDTPAVSSSNSGTSSPCSFPGKNSCVEEENDLPDMFQNYMDYTDDECMNLFTVCQKQRMRTVLESSPRRATLLHSHALQDPVMVSNDLGIKSILSPSKSSCSNITIPGIEVRNYGIDHVTSLEAELYLNGDLIETLPFTVDLAPLDIISIHFSSLTLSSDQENEVSFYITQVNGVDDGNTSNNTKHIALPTVESQLIPYFEGFENNTSNSVYRSTENNTNSKWLFAYESAFLPFYNQTENFGIQDMLLTEVLDLSSLTSAVLTFNYAYAPRLTNDPNINYLDGLVVAVSTNCGQDFFRQDYLFEAYGNALATTTPTNESFIPSTSDWKEVSLDFLTNYTGNENVQVAFIGVNGSGNNIYLDDIKITSANLLANDAGLRSIDAIPVVTCSGSFSPSLEVKNYGYEKIESLDFSLEINGNVQNGSFSGLDMLSGVSENFKTNLNEPLEEGVHEILFTINQVNGLDDEQPLNNSLSYFVVVNSESETIPVAEDFENTYWITVSPTNESVFEETRIDGNKVLMGNAFESPKIGTQSYLVSPTLKTAGYKEASIRFKYSYAQRTGFNDNLKVLLSFNCGRNYHTEVFNLNSEELAITTSNKSWEPKSDQDWKTAFVDISEHMNWDEIRVAFVFTNGNGNNIYLDDVQILTSADPNLPVFDDLMVIYPNPTVENGSFNISLNLLGKQDVEIRIIDMSGKVVYSEQFPGSINQTYKFNTPGPPGGFFLVQMLGSDGVLNQVKRLYIRH